MTRFRNLFDALKMSILNSYTKSNFFTRNWARGVNGLQAILTTNRVVSKQADDMGKEHANMKFVKTLWNLAETGLPEKVISWMKPGIKYGPLAYSCILKALFHYSTCVITILMLT
jgi:hypothetical protein